MQQELLLVGIKLDELLLKIEHIIDKKLARIDELNEESENKQKYLSRTEVARMLKITLPTLHDWTCNLKILQSYKIGNRVLYKQDEVESALTKSSTIKFKRHIK